MKIGILSTANPDMGGVYQYTVSLIEALGKYDSSKFDYVQIRTSDFPKLIDEDIIINSSKANFLLKLKRGLYCCTGIKINSILGVYNNPEVKNIDLIISPTISFHPYYIGKPYIVTIHDFQHKYHPSFFTCRDIVSREIIYRTGKKANFVICESEHVKKDIIRFLKISKEKISVLPSPPPPYIQNTNVSLNKLGQIAKKYHLPKKYLFYPAQFWPHKNHIALLKAIVYIRDFYKEDINLIMVGSKKNNFENVMDEVEKLGLNSQVKWIGYVPNEEMVSIYKLSTALVMPTFFESVSLPIWEAFYLGCPVVSSNICALPEQIGNAGLLFNPSDIQDMAVKINSIWSNKELRRALIQKGYERVKTLTLKDYAKQWERIIEGMLIQ